MPELTSPREAAPMNRLAPNIVQAERRSVLMRELERRQTENPRYSQRAFARDLGVSHSLLSLIVGGRREVSDALAQRLLEIANLPIEVLESVKLGLPPDLPDRYERIELEKFALISDWVHYAILSLLEVEGAHWDADWIANRLGLKLTRVKAAMARLEALGLVKHLESGRVIQAVAPIVVENKVSSEAARKYNSQLMQKAAESMDEVAFESRDLSSTIFTLNPKYIPYAIERIRNFRRSLTNELENLGEQGEVYALAVQLFPLTKLKDEK